MIPKKKSSRAAIKAIAREYELKKAELSGGAPNLRKGPVFYAIVILVLLVVGGLVLSAAKDGKLIGIIQCHIIKSAAKKFCHSCGLTNLPAAENSYHLKRFSHRFKRFLYISFNVHTIAPMHILGHTIDKINSQIQILSVPHIPKICWFSRTS